MKKFKVIQTAVATAMAVSMLSLTACDVLDGLLGNGSEGDGKTYDVTFNLDGGDLTTSLSSYVSGVETTLPDAVKTHYIFDGWYADEDFSGDAVETIEKSSKGNVEYWAKWTPETYSVEYYIDGEAYTESDVTSYTYNVLTDLPEPEKANYSFTGWYENSNCTGKSVMEIAQGEYGNKTYYAKWTPDTYKVTLNLNGGTVKNNITGYTYNEEKTLPIPTKAGYAFDGWYDNSNCTGSKWEVITVGETGNKTFYAKWTETNILAGAGYEEGAYVNIYPDGKDLNKISVAYKLLDDSHGYTKIDSALIREKKNDDGETYYRADIVGLAEGVYSLQVTVGSKVEYKDVTVSEYDRSGYAHFNATEGVGGYNADGTPKSNAEIIYVSEETKNSVSVTWDKTYTGIVQILNNANKCTKPLIVRVIGTIKAATWNTLRYVNESGKAITVDKVISSDGTKILKDYIESLPSTDNIIKNKKIYQQDLIDLGYNTLNTDEASILNNLSSRISISFNSNGTVKEFDSCWNDCPISQAQNVTVEGIGTDAGFFQWGMTWSRSNSIEVRNLTFTDCTEDACSFEGSVNATEISGFDSSRVWVHHNTFNKGKNYWDVCPEQDKWDGDGSTDFKRAANITISYNTYNYNHKTGLVGADDAVMTANVTFHHNYYNNCEARLPLARQANMHMYNNYYLGNGKSGSCMSIRSGAYAFVEYCYFDNAKAPIACVVGTKKLDSDSRYLYGYAKVYNCTFNKIDVTASDYIKKTDDRMAKFDTDCRFGKNFDTDSSLFYYDTANKCSKVTNLITTLDDIPVEIPKLAGVRKI